MVKVIRWIVIYPVDSVFQSSNNRGQLYNIESQYYITLFNNYSTSAGWIWEDSKRGA